MTKEEQIEELRKKPFEIGENIVYTINYTENILVKVKEGRKWVFKTQEEPKICKGSGDIISWLNEDTAVVKTSDSVRFPSFITMNYTQDGYKLLTLNKSYISHDYAVCGNDPFQNQDWNARINFYQSDIQGILSRCAGWEKRITSIKHEKIGDIIVPELNWNPVVICEGQEINYQRGFVWTLAEKQLLIDSIYNNIEIGKFVIRRRSWSWVEKRIKAGKIENTAFCDIVDGKQRLNTIISFILGEFPDSFGNYWSDLSTRAQWKFYNYRYATYGELGESATDEQVLKTFLTINHTGLPQSEEHINFVKSLL